MKITVITPFYKGQEYIDDYCRTLLKNADSLKQDGHVLNVILVNDSPEVEVSLPDEAKDLVQVLANEKNSGIHFSRVAGLKKAAGDYVMFLDQDDLLTEDALSLMAKRADETGADVLVANAMLEQADKSQLLWYRNDYHKSLVGDLDTYLRVGIQIISPGQCLIKKSSIPDFWQDHLVRVNGADDYYLWLLMLAKGMNFEYLDQALYIHKYTGSNISADTTATDASVYDFLDLLADCPDFPQEYIFALHEMISYKSQFRQASGFGKITCSLAHLNLLLTNIRFKCKTGTKYGFNR